uniref:Uncharacterized protein n=1 Tax=Oryza nivara TaxID=4536 RepID=A0A0E0HW60_ORYNI
MEDTSVLVAWAIRLGKEEFLTCCSTSSSSWICCLHFRSVSSHSSVARFSFFCQRNNGPLVICHLLDVSSANSNLICAISSLSRKELEGTQMHQRVPSCQQTITGLNEREIEPYLELVPHGRRGLLLHPRIAGGRARIVYVAPRGDSSGRGSSKGTPCPDLLAPPAPVHAQPASSRIVRPAAEAMAAGHGGGRVSPAYANGDGGGFVRPMGGRPWSRAFSAVVGDGSGGAASGRKGARRHARPAGRRRCTGQRGACRGGRGAWVRARTAEAEGPRMAAEAAEPPVASRSSTASSPTATHTLPHGGRSYAPTSSSCSPSSLTASSTWSTAKQTDDVGLARLVDFADVKRIDDRMYLWTDKLDPLLLQGIDGEHEQRGGAVPRSRHVGPVEPAEPRIERRWPAGAGGGAVERRGMRTGIETA